jgi:hypothetical protein
MREIEQPMPHRASVFGHHLAVRQTSETVFHPGSVLLASWVSD